VAEQLRASASIDATGLSRSFGDKAAVRGIDLEVGAGSIFGLLGPNGAGKTTVVRMLTTLLAPSGGSARVAGFEITRQAAQVRRAIGVALQETALDPLMTGAEMLRLQAALHAMPAKAARQRAAALLEVLELGDVAAARVKTYSGGTRRRLDLALALIHSPGVLFLDEPTTGIDPTSRQAIWDLIRSLSQEQGATVFLTTQYLEEADRLCDEIAIMDAGLIVRRGVPETLKAAVDVPTLRVTVPAGQRDQAAAALARFGEARPAARGAVGIGLAGGAAAMADVIRALDEAGVGITHVALDMPTLDDVFADATGRRMPAAAADEPSRVGTDAVEEQV
jgi:ABC-2 type transport system ATP-binding protein